MIDAHCHVDVGPVLPYLASRKDSEDPKILISSAYKPESWEEHRKLKDRYAINICAGIHPFLADDVSEDDLERLPDVIDALSAIALGEIGLDYHKEYRVSRDKQIIVFRKQLRLAQERNLPVIIHCRKAIEECLKILGEYDIPAIIFHAYSGSYEQVRQIEKLPAYFSFGFPITYPENHKQTEVLQKISREKILLETDAPFMKKESSASAFSSTPADIRSVYHAAEDILNINQDELIILIRENAECIWDNLVEFKRY